MKKEQGIKEILTLLYAKVRELENQIAVIQNKNVILDERKIPEEKGGLGGKLISKRGETIAKTILLPFCDICHLEISEKNFSICECGKKVCENCTITWEHMTYCPICFERILPISKKTYKVLIAVHNNVTRISEITKLSKMKKKEIERAYNELFDKGFVVKEGILKRRRITDDGIVALDMCSKLYGEDVDVAYLLSELAQRKR